MRQQHGWRERYAGYEPDLHGVDRLDLGPRKGVSLRPWIDEVARDTRLASAAPLKPTRKVNGVRA